MKNVQVRDQLGDYQPLTQGDPCFISYSFLNCLSISRTELRHDLNSGRFLNVALPYTCQYLLFKTDVTTPHGKFFTDSFHCAVCKLTHDTVSKCNLFDAHSFQIRIHSMEQGSTNCDGC